MPYKGEGFEDGWIATEDALEKFKHKIYREVNVIVPDTATVEEFISEIGTQVKKGQPLITFSFVNENAAQDYSELYSNDFTEDEFILNNKKITIESPVDGIIKDIRIYINGNADKKIETAWNKITRNLKQYINKASRINKDDMSYLDNIDTSMFKRGTHKYKSRQFKGARILFLIETERVPTYGDKFVFRGGNKGTVTAIIPKDKKPKALDTGLEIDWIHNTLSVLGRKNANILLELGVGKVLYFLNKKAKEMAENSKIKTKDIKKLVLDVYNALDQTENKEYYNKIKEKINSIPDDEFRKLCKQIDPLNRPLFVWLALPFTKMKVEWIKDAAHILNIPLEEKVYIPELESVTQLPVTVGIAYATMLEYMPDIMMGYRSTERYASLTGQAVKGQSNIGIGGARIDELTLSGLIDYLGGDSKLIEELYTVQSDDHVAKEDVQFQIIQKGLPPEQYKRDETKTKKLLRILLYGKGLNPNF
jgi:DNA-directed RNA polymerase beta subunit